MVQLIPTIVQIVGKQFGVTIIVIPKVIKLKVKNCLSSHNLEITPINILVNILPDFFSKCVCVCVCVSVCIKYIVFLFRKTIYFIHMERGEDTHMQVIKQMEYNFNSR